jgi:RNA polymerase sigma-70 factor, ECF subfamily
LKAIIEADDDRSLLTALAHGNRVAFATLVQRHTRRFYAVAYRVLGHREDAEEVVQDAFLMLWARPEVWNANRGTKFTTWFYRVVMNKALDLLRKRAVSAKTSNIDDLKDKLASDGDVEKDLATSQQLERVKQALDKLPDRQRMAIVLCFYDGRPQTEAAEILGISVKALEALLIRAKTSLRRELS